MSDAFPAASLTEWEPVPSIVNEKDQHVLNVAPAAEADVVVTEDTSFDDNSAAMAGSRLSDSMISSCRKRPTTSRNGPLSWSRWLGAVGTHQSGQRYCSPQSNAATPGSQQSSAHSSIDGPESPCDKTLDFAAPRQVVATRVT
jgi:hypothetical protein